MAVKTLQNFRHFNVRMDIEIIPVSQADNYSIVTFVFKYYVVETNVPMSIRITNALNFKFKVDDQTFTKSNSIYTVELDGTKLEVWKLENVKIEHDNDGTKKSNLSFTSIRANTSSFKNSELSSTSVSKIVLNLKPRPQFSTVVATKSLFLDQPFTVDIQAPSSHFRHTISIYMDSETKDNEIGQYTNQPGGKTIHKFSENELQKIYNKLGTRTSTILIIKCDTYKGDVLSGTTRFTTSNMFTSGAKPYDFKSQDGVEYSPFDSISLIDTITTVYNWNKSKFTFKVVSPDTTKNYKLVLYLYSITGSVLTVMYTQSNIKDKNKTFSFSMSDLCTNYIFKNVKTAKQFIIRVNIETFNSSNVSIDQEYKYLKFQFDSSAYDLIPSSATVSYIDSNTKTSTLIGNNQILVQNQSTLQIQYSNATVKQQANYGDITVTLGTKSKRYTRSTSSGTITITKTDTSDLLNQNGDLLLTVLFEDSRGYSSKKEFTVKVLEYSNPTFQLQTPARYTATSTTVNFQVKGTISPLIVNGVVKNAVKTAVLHVDDGREINIINHFRADTTRKGYYTAEMYLTAFLIDRVYKFELILTDNLDVSVLESDAKISDLQNAKPLLKITPSGVDFAIPVDRIYPVGSIYITVAPTSPATLFGGTWIRFAQGRTLIGLNESDSYYNTSMETGGTTSHYHSVRTALNWWYGAPCGEGEPDSTGVYNYQNNSYDGWDKDASPGRLTIARNNGLTASSTQTEAVNKYSEGTTSTTRNVPPYIVCYMWRRTS